MQRGRYGWAIAILFVGGCCCAHPPKGGTAAPPNTATKGIIWVDQHDMVVSESDRIKLSTNGTAVFVDTKPGIVFPENDLVPIFVPTLSPGLNITGIRVCYGIVGSHPDTEVHRLRLAQFDPSSGGGTYWPGYLVKMEDVSTSSQAPTPPAGGFAFGDPAGFVCVDSTAPACLDPNNGTIDASIGVQFGATGDRLVVMAVGLHYDSSCTPN